MNHTFADDRMTYKFCILRSQVMAETDYAVLLISQISSLIPNLLLDTIAA